MPELTLMARHLPLLLLLLALPAAAQLHLTSLAEVELGDLPGQSSTDLRTLYHQLNLDYGLGDFSLGLRGESFGSSASGRSYAYLAQRYLRYRRGPLAATAGNFYAIFGSGLLLHAFELPGVITEARGARRRYQLARDLDGLHLQYQGQRARAQLLYGIPVDSSLPPGLEEVDRRQGSVLGGAFAVQAHRFVETGLVLLRARAAGEEQTGTALHGRVRLPLESLHAELYAEYAHRDLEPGRFFSLSRGLGRGLYLSATLASGPLGLSLEYKDYQDLLISNINNPPPLVREHDAFLLNRLTHVLLPDDETGYQIEASCALPWESALTANLTRATRRWAAGPGDDDRLTEVFLRAETPFGEGVRGQFFAGHNRDRIIPRNNERHTTWGTAWDWSMDDRHTLSADLQYQDAERRFGRLALPFENIYVDLGISRAPGASLSLTLQRSTDELETGASPTGATYWWGLNAGWEFRAGHSAGLFAGKRRAGLACTAGTCYEVLGFEGVELRLVDQVF
jgi:hypothetical protein